jgi:hypothetical protein
MMEVVVLVGVAQYRGGADVLGVYASVEAAQAAARMIAERSDPIEDPQYDFYRLEFAPVGGMVLNSRIFEI